MLLSKRRRFWIMAVAAALLIAATVFTVQQMQGFASKEIGNAEPAAVPVPMMPVR